jgi:hypothetical protein
LRVCTSVRTSNNSALTPHPTPLPMGERADRTLISSITIPAMVKLL